MITLTGITLSRFHCKSSFINLQSIFSDTQCRSEVKPSFEIQKEGKPSEITVMQWGRRDNEIVIGNKDGELKLYNTELNKIIKTFDKLEGSGPVIGVGCQNKNFIVAAKNSGHINIWNVKKCDSFKIDVNERGSLDKMICSPYRENIIGIGGSFNDLKLWDIEKRSCVFKAKSVSIKTYF